MLQPLPKQGDDEKHPWSSPNGSRQDDHRDLKLRELLPLVGQLQDGVEGLEPTDKQDTLDASLADVLGDGLVLSLGQGPFGAEEGAAHRGPAVDRLPRHALDVSVDEPLDAVVDAERVVA